MRRSSAILFQIVRSGFDTLSSLDDLPALCEETFHPKKDQSGPDGTKTNEPMLVERLLEDHHAQQELHGRVDILENTQCG